MDAVQVVFVIITLVLFLARQMIVLYREHHEKDFKNKKKKKVGIDRINTVV